MVVSLQHWFLVIASSIGCFIITLIITTSLIGYCIQPVVGCVLQWHETEQRDDPEGLSGVHPPAEEGPGPGEADGDPPETAGDEQQEAAPQNAGVCPSSPNLLQ